MKPEHISPFRTRAMFSRSITVLCLILPWFSSALLLASGSETVRIEIKSSWGGLGEPTKGNLVITGIRGKYSSEDRKVDAKAVEFLLAALEQPVVDQPSLEACGITERWLLANYARGLEDYTHEKLKDLSPKQVELFKAHFIDVAGAQVAFGELFKGWHTDDYPEMSVTVDTGGRIFGVQSSSQHPFMLPWLGTDRARGGYNCQITQAIAALLPKKFSNRDRLVLSDSFRWKLTEQIMRMVEHQWNLLDTEFKVGPEVAPSRCWVRLLVEGNRASNEGSSPLAFPVRFGPRIRGERLRHVGLLRLAKYWHACETRWNADEVRGQPSARTNAASSNC